MTKQRSLKWLAIMGAILIVLFLAVQGFAEGSSGRLQRVGVWGTYGDAFDKPSSYDFVGFNPYWGLFLRQPQPGRDWSIEFAVEGFYYRHRHALSSKYEVGAQPIIRFHYGFGKMISPFFELSTAGLSYTNLDVPETGSDINFSSHAGVGVDITLDPNWTLGLAYRLRHLSNAGLSDNNAGINHHQWLVGLGYTF